MKGYYKAFLRLTKACIAHVGQRSYDRREFDQYRKEVKTDMYTSVFRYGTCGILMTVLLSVAYPLFAQHRPFPDFGPPSRPLIKLIGFLNPDLPDTTVQPVLTLAFPDDEKRYTFLLTDMRIMAGPLRTPGDILDEVKPYSTNFYIRASREVTSQITSATPAERLTILAEYSRADRSLMVKGIEKSEEPQLH
jgi:hypothetical protein